jgi:glycine cleavage system H protein
VKEFSELIFREDFRYTEDHEWVGTVAEYLQVGVSDYAQDQMGDIVFVELPDEGAVFAKGEQFGTLESVKAVSELYLPVGGEIIAVNSALSDSPELINADPYGTWLVRIKPTDPGQIEQLLTADAYRQMLQG